MCSYTTETLSSKMNCLSPTRKNIATATFCFKYHISMLLRLIYFPIKSTYLNWVCLNHRRVIIVHLTVFFQYFK